MKYFLLKVLRGIKYISLCFFFLSAQHVNKEAVYYLTNKDISLIKNSASGSWYEVKPVLKTYSNFMKRSRNFVELDMISYKTKKISSEKSFNIAKYVKEHGYGTYYFSQHTLKSHIASYKALHLMKKYKIIQVVYRSDSSYIGFLHELLRTPFIWLPLNTGKYHQTDKRIGSDCVSFVIYGMRRSGYSIPYTHPYRVIKYFKSIAHGPLYPDKSGLYKSQGGRVVSIKKSGLKKGDIIYFKKHVAIFYKDTGKIGVLDKDDILFHSLRKGPHYSTIEKCGYYNLPLYIYKWDYNKIRQYIQKNKSP